MNIKSCFDRQLTFHHFQQDDGKAQFCSFVDESCQMIYSREEMKKLRHGFFVIIEAGAVDLTKKWLKEADIDVLKTDHNGYNILQLFCKSANLPEEIWKTENIRLEGILSDKSFSAYQLLEKMYKEAVFIATLQREEKEKLVFEAKKAEEKNETQKSFFSSFCCLPKNTLKDLELIFRRPCRFPTMKKISSHFQRFFVSAAKGNKRSK